MNVIQLDFFKSKEECEFEALLLKYEAIEKSLGKVRRGMYAKLGDHDKKIDNIDQRLAVLERNICKGIV